MDGKESRGLRAVPHGDEVGREEGPQPREERNAVRWLLARESPFEIPVLDCRPIALGMTSTTSSATIAERFLTLRDDPGEGLTGVELPDSVPLPLPFDYPLCGRPPAGPVFKALAMEDKWDVYQLDGMLYFCRSWTGDLVYQARIDWTPTFCRVVEIRHDRRSGATHLHVQAVLDFLMKSHLCGIIAPHPLRQIDDPTPDRLALASFSDFGRRGWYGTFEDARGLRSVRSQLWGWPERVEARPRNE